MDRDSDKWLELGTSLWTLPFEDRKRKAPENIEEFLNSTTALEGGRTSFATRKVWHICSVQVEKSRYEGEGKIVFYLSICSLSGVMVSSVPFYLMVINMGKWRDFNILVGALVENGILFLSLVVMQWNLFYSLYTKGIVPRRSINKLYAGNKGLFLIIQHDQYNSCIKKEFNFFFCTLKTNTILSLECLTKKKMTCLKSVAVCRVLIFFFQWRCVIINLCRKEGTRLFLESLLQERVEDDEGGGTSQT